MEGRGKLSRILRSARQYIRTQAEKGERARRERPFPVEARKASGKSALRQADAGRMTRVTDDLGNEYYCPLGVLKDPNFVREEEKTSCFDYKILSADRSD